MHSVYCEFNTNWPFAMYSMVPGTGGVRRYTQFASMVLITEQNFALHIYRINWMCYTTSSGSCPVQQVIFGFGRFKNRELKKISKKFISTFFTFPPPRPSKIRKLKYANYQVFCQGGCLLRFLTDLVSDWMSVNKPLKQMWCSESDEVHAVEQLVEALRCSRKAADLNFSLT